MKKTKSKLLICLICVLALILVGAVLVLIDSQSKDPVLKAFKSDASQETTEAVDDTTDPTEGSGNTDATTPTEKENTEENTEEDASETLTPPQDLPSSVVIPTEKDPQTGENVGLTFPCQVPGYGLVIEKMAAYSGIFVEDGTNANTDNVAMLLVHNNGDYPVEYTQICVTFGEQTLQFDISALPVGDRVVVQEKSGQAMPEGVATAANALVVQRADMSMSENMVKVTDNGNNTLTIENVSDTAIATVRVFYKHYMPDQGIFVGGIAFTVRVTRLNPGTKITIQPSHYTSQTSRVVMVLTYDSEV